MATAEKQGLIQEFPKKEVRNQSRLKRKQGVPNRTFIHKRALNEARGLAKYKKCLCV